MKWNKFKNYNKNKSIFNRHTILLSWLISYIIVLLIPFAGNLIVNARVHHIIEEDIFASNKMRLEILRDKVDVFFHESERIASEMMGDDGIAKLSQANSADNFTRYDAISIGNMFQRHIFSASHQISGYLYFPKMDMILSNNSLIDSKTFYDTYYSDSGISYNEWMMRFTGKERSLYATNTTYGNVGVGEAIENIRELWMLGKGSEERTVVVTLISGDTLFSNLTDADEDSSIMILDENKKILVGKGQEYEDDFFCDMKFDKNNSTAAFKYKSQNQIASSIASKWNGMQYVYIIKEADFNKKMSLIWRVMIVWVSIAVLVGVGMIIVIIRNNYRPLKNLISILKKMEYHDEFNSQNEYIIIKEVINKLIDGNNVKDSVLKRQKDNLQNMYLSNIIEGKNIKNSFQKLSSVGIVFKKPVFYIALISIEDLGKFAEGNSDVEYNMRLAIYALSNIISEILEAHFPVNICEINNTIVCVVNTDGERKDKDILKENLIKAQDSIGYYFDTIITVAISGEGRDAENLHRLYNDAVSAEEYRNIIGGEDLIDYTEIEEDSKTAYGYSKAKWHELVHIIDTGDLTNAERMLDEIIKSDFEENLSSKRIKQGMACILISMIAELEAGKFEFINQCSEYMKKITSSFSIAEFRDSVMNLSQMISAYREHEIENAPTLSDDIKSYIHKNYDDYDLNVSLIGQKFNMTSAYLSKLFTEQTGVKLLDYINMYRVDRAKKLLLDQPEMKIEQVGEYTGFSVNRTFLRTFKKYEGISPSVYREQNNK